MKRMCLVIFTIVGLAACQTAPNATLLAECEDTSTEVIREACEEQQLREVRDVRQDIQKIRQTREKRS